LSDFSQNSYKLERYLTLRDNLKSTLNPNDIAYNGVFIARGQTGAKRLLINEKEVIAHLEKKGFDIIYPEKMTVEVITVEGSAHNHAIYSMNLKGAMLELQPPSRFGIIIKGACDCLGIGWGFYVCAPSNDGEGFYVDNFNDLDRAIKQLQER
jgi:capsular polysaccharide biosynthesis protein